jgi:Alpha-glutamyl/putrescinyl thymine pyrophosphorylase clade 3
LFPYFPEVCPPVARFCRHNRFIERCPICRETLPENIAPQGPAGGARAKRPGAAAAAKRRRVKSTQGVRVYSGGARAGEDDGFRSSLVPGLHSSTDAERLAGELAFANGRLLALTSAPPSLYAELRDERDLEQSTWACLLAAYLSPLQGDDPFVGIRQAMQTDWHSGGLPDLDGIPLGPRTSHDPARGTATLAAYRQWVARLGTQASAFTGDHAWSRPRRFERIFERLTLPGLGRMGRYDLLVTLGRVGLYEMRADSLHLAAGTAAAGDLTTLAAKRVFGIGDPLNLERRVSDLAKAIAVPVEAFDLALANWGTGERATLGFDAEGRDEHSLERTRSALGL